MPENNDPPPKKVEFEYLPCCFGELDECNGGGEGCPHFLACREESYTLKMQRDFPNTEIFIGVL